MPEKPRSDVLIADEVGVYHCWNRLVQHRCLFGHDFLTGKDFSYRKDWVRVRLMELAGSMAIDVLDYAVLDNHLHIVLRNRPDIVSGWTDEEVARRWWYVCPIYKNKDGSIPDPLPSEISMYKKSADEFRKRLSDISWLMRLLCQPIACRANREDEVDGRFFAKRFGCSRLESVADILACSLYVDLNIIHAGMASSPEKSKYTSAFERIQARWAGTRTELQGENAPPVFTDSDAWLAPIYLDESAAAYMDVEQASACNPVGSSRISDKGFLPITTEQYLSLLDVVGRVIRKDKTGHIPKELPPILERLGFEPQGWLDSLVGCFSRHPSYTSPAIINTG